MRAGALLVWATALVAGFFLLEAANAKDFEITSEYAVTGSEMTTCTTFNTDDQWKVIAGQCEPNSEVSVKRLQNVKLNKQQRKKWRKTCTLLCLRKDNCLGYIAKPTKKPKRCELMGGAGCQGLNLVRPKKKNKVNKTVLQSDCFAPKVETKSPTMAPIFDECALPPTFSPTFQLEFQQLQNTPYNFELFEEVKPNRRLCELMQLKANEASETLENFPCSEADCFRWCSYFTGCRFVSFNPETRTCTRAGYMELTDDSARSEAYHSSGTKVWKRNTVTLSYFSGYCNELVRVGCQADDQCGWNQGKRGYNDQEQGGSAGGYCGRTRCNAA